MSVIITSQCETCRYGTVDDSNKAKVKVHCDYKDKEYYFGQCVPCDFYERQKNEIS